MVQINRNVEGYLGHFEFGTDRDGRFAFANIPPMQDWYLYGLMDSLKGSGSIPVRTVKTGAHGSTLDVGDIEVQPGYRLTGRLVLADGKPVPPETRVLASRSGPGIPRRRPSGRTAGSRSPASRPSNSACPRTSGVIIPRRRMRASTCSTAWACWGRSEGTSTTCGSSSILWTRDRRPEVQPGRQARNTTTSQRPSPRCTR